MEESSRSYSSNEYGLASSPKDHISTPPKKKHSMVLSLGNKSSSAFGADQTPTPTRFIRNCEEVGLFQDLQNVNPFEETFRKAVESGKTGGSALQNTRPLIVPDDSLHTPHVFPHIIENDSVNRTEMIQKAQQEKYIAGRENERNGVLRPTLKVVRQEADTSQLRTLGQSSFQAGPWKSPPNQSDPVQLILQMPDGRLMQLNATPLDVNKKTDLQGPVDLVARVDKSKSEGDSMILDVHTNPAKRPDPENVLSPLIKAKLKARLNSASGNSLPDKSSGSGNQRAEKGVKKEEGLRSKRSSTASNASNSEDDEETKRRKFLERNRAAAMRCREKRKCWVMTLERRAEQMMLTNQQLQLEVGALRAEVAHLKTLLLAHKDCPVTQAMCNNQVGFVAVPVNLENPPLNLTPVHVVKPLNEDEAAFRHSLKKKLKTVSVKNQSSFEETENTSRSRVEIPKKKRLSLDIESAKQSQCMSSKEQSPIVRSDEYLSSTLLQNEPLELDIGKPVATQVIQVNPNALFRESSLRLTSPTIEGPLLPISPQTSCIDYS